MVNSQFDSSMLQAAITAAVTQQVGAFLSLNPQFGHASQQGVVVWQQNAAAGYENGASPQWMQSPINYGLPPMPQFNAYAPQQQFQQAQFRPQPPLPQPQLPVKPSQSKLSENDIKIRYDDDKIRQFGVAERGQARDAHGNRVNYKDITS